MTDTPNNIKTVAEVMALIPPEWIESEMYIANTIGALVRIKRVSLCTNNAGRRVVLLHEDDFSK